MAEDDIDAGEDQVQLSFGEFLDFTAMQSTIEGNNLRNISNRVPWKPRCSRRKQDIARGLRPSNVACQWHANDRPDTAPVESISLNYDNRSSEAGAGTCRIWQVRPVHMALGDYHSTCWSTRLAAAETAGSGRVSTASHTLFIASVTASGSWRARYSVTASVYTLLRDFLSRRDRRSASAYTLSGIEMAVFIPKV